MTVFIAKRINVHFREGHTSIVDRYVQQSNISGSNNLQVDRAFAEQLGG